jgi:hypothetical protein
VQHADHREEKVVGCYNDDVLFVHIPKCGGTAVKAYMAENLPGVKWPRPATWFMARDGRLEVTEADRKAAHQSTLDASLPIGHVPLRDIPRFTGRPLDSWDKIIVTIRNPYYQQISQWLFWRERYATGDYHAHDIHAASHPRFDSWVGTPNADFHVWYEQRFHEGESIARKPPSAETSYEGWGGFYPYWVGVDGAIPDNVHMIRMEEMSHQLPLALAPYMDGPPPEMYRRNEGPVDESKYLRYITDAPNTIKTIEAKFKWTFENGIYGRGEPTS